MSDLAALAGAEWLNQPPEFSHDAAGLHVVTGERTDFWQRSFYGFRRDDGHALLVAAPPEFTATLRFEGDYRKLYDQAGLMLRIDAETWAKAGIEYSDGATNFSVVVTRDGWSDWSVVAAPGLSGPQELRLTRKGGAVIVHVRRGARENTAQDWQHIRLAAFPEATAGIGPMACSPERAGFRASFSEFRLHPALDRPLH